MDREEILVEEWKEIRETIRYFGNKRFAQLTVFLAITGFALNAFGDRSISAPEWLIPTVGLTNALLFLCMEMSSNRYWTAFLKRGQEIEGELQGVIKMMSKSRPDPRFGGRDLGTAATLSLHYLVLVFWFVALCFQNLFR
jgi:hypothetical protein